ncbi:MAG: hypothetical protein IPH35_19795 [Rhodoferax sp.]|nr:hypothetical protein [Rhodoferax sp.]
MSNAVAFDYYPDLAGTFELPSNRGVFGSTGLILFQRQSLPTDPIGTTTVTFAGVNAGSEIRVYLPDGTETAGVESCDANHVLTWSVYASGSSNNTVTIRIVNTAYKIKEFSYTSVAGTQSLPVQQEADKWYVNP